MFADVFRSYRSTPERWWTGGDFDYLSATLTSVVMAGMGWPLRRDLSCCYN